MIGIVVTYNTPKLIKEAIASIKKFYPDLSIIIVDGSPKYSSCYEMNKFIEKKYKKIKLIHAGYNVGHGPGMDLGIKNSVDEEILIFDSDIEMNKPCLESMQQLLQSNKFIYGVGQIIKTDVGGNNSEHGFPYLHPHFALIKRNAYNRYSPFVQHGAPCIMAMKDLNRSQYLYCKHFPVYDFILHKERGTRKVISKEEFVPTMNVGMKQPMPHVSSLVRFAKK